MARVRAVVLAAGRGVRMRENRPKTLVPVADEAPLLRFILAGLERAGVDDLLVVTGYGAGDIEAFVSEHWSANATFVFNARWASWGNFHTVRLAVDQSPGFDLLTVNSDVVVHPDVYRRTAEKPGDLVLAVQRRRRLDEEDMRVQLAKDRVRAIGKHVKLSRSHGEFSGVSLLRPEAAARYAQIATDLEWRATTSGYYEDVYGMMLDAVDARASFVEEDEYAEVDVPEDMTTAREVIRVHRDSWGDLAAAPAQPQKV